MMPIVKIPEAISSNHLPIEIPVVDSKDIRRGFAHYYHPDGYRVALLPDFYDKIRDSPQTRKVITDDSGRIVASKITLTVWNPNLNAAERRVPLCSGICQSISSATKQGSPALPRLQNPG